MDLIKILKIKTIVLALCLSPFCFGEGNLIELIDKCDFVNFKKAYETASLSEEQKAELLQRVNENIDLTSKKLRPYFIGGFPSVNQGKQFKLQEKLSLFGTCLMFGTCTMGPILIAYAVYQENKALLNQYNLPVALFAPFANYANYAQYTAERDARINENKIGYLAASSFALFGCLFNSFLLYLRNLDKKMLLIYQQYKKALKIKALMQGSMKEFELLKLGIGGLK